MRPPSSSASAFSRPWNPGSLLRVTMLGAGLFLTALPSPTPAQNAEEKEKAKLPKTGRLIFAHGQGIPGTMESATDRTLFWKSAFFARPAELRYTALRSVEMEVPVKTPLPADPIAVILRNGGIFYGSLESIDDETVTLNSQRCGKVILPRDEVATLRWIKQGPLILNAPVGVAGISHPGKPPVGRRWHGVSGGEVTSVGWKHRGIVPVDLPKKAEVSFTIRSSNRPEFEVSLVQQRQNALIKTWDDEIVVRRGADHLSLMSLKDDDREVTLRMFWDQENDSGMIATADGTILGKWRTTGGKPGTQLVEDGIPVVILAKRELPKPKTPIPDGIAFNNLGRDITIESIQVRRWDGKAPSAHADPDLQGTPRLELISGESIGIFTGGMIESADATSVRLTGRDQPIPLSEIEAIVFTEPPSKGPAKPESGFSELAFDDGTRLFGKILSLQKERLSLKLGDEIEPIELNSKGLFNLVFNDEIEPEFLDGSFNRGDKITFENLTIHGHWVPAKGEQPSWRPPGAEGGVPLAEGKAFEISRTYPEDREEIPQSEALVHLDGGQILPTKITGIGRNGDWVELNSEYAETKRFESSAVQAVQYPGAKVNPNLFEDGGWRVVRGKLGNQVILENEEKQPRNTLTLNPGGAWGHASILQGTEVKFNLQTNGYGTLRVRLFGGNTEAPDEACTRILLAHFGDEVYCGSEVSPGDFGNRRDIQAESGKPVPIRLTWDSKKLTVFAKGQQAVVVPVTEQYPRKGISLVFEPADLWGNGEREIKVSDFSLKAAPGMISSPPILTEAKERALTIPRFRRDDAPKQVLLAWNGDLLRGSIESATQKAYSFRTGLETHQIPINRIAAAIWLDPPVGESEEEPPSEDKNEEAAADAKGGQIRVGAVQVKALGAQIGLAGNLRPMIQARGGVVQVAGQQQEPKLIPADGHHSLRLYNGGELAMKVDSFGPEFISGSAGSLGACRIPVALVGSIRTGKSSEPATGSAPFLGWQLEHAPEPTPGDGQGDGTDSPLVGNPAPPIDLPLLTEGKFKLEKGKVVILDFWATWCGPCVRALPAMMESFSRFDPEKVSFVAINQAEGPDTIRKFLDRRGWSDLTVALDAQQTVAGAYGVQGIPHTVIIDAEGKVAWVKTGFHPEGAEQAAAVVDELLAK